ncbi:hypothetical protein [Pararhizobium mangrovi]|uniref:Uncharacterized protein n=1 Tax=Pararhizobium mangrovi TaxID=2590452 RepID=A0A506TXN9_9HYPH|nr:hypothetical protein [Pararhizobium mangrovi]TPW26076.1 hypothetical protein FJU11_16425 [Pararhizobium mangrovi]
MHTIRAFFSTVVGLAVTSLAFAVAAAFSFAVIVVVGFAAVAGLAVVKLVPFVRVGLVNLQIGTRSLWQGGRQAVLRA